MMEHISAFFHSEQMTQALRVLQTEFPMAIWETLYVTVLSMFFAALIGLPLGVLLVVGERGWILPLKKPVDVYKRQACCCAVSDSRRASI